MPNKPKAIGTRAETAVVRYLREELDDDRVERRALHGSKDMGDIFGIWAHGYSGIAEVKAHKTWGPKDLYDWQMQTLDERDNADSDFALLVVKVPNRNVSQWLVYVTIRDLTRVCRSIGVSPDFEGTYDDVWVCMTLRDAARRMKGV